MVTITNVTYDGLRGRLAEPAQPNGAGVLVMPGWIGLNADTDRCSTRLAEAGFTAIGWDPFSAYPADVSEEVRRRATQGEILDVNARAEHIRWVDYLRDELGLESVGAMGFCMGGRMSMLLGAEDPRVAAVSTYYPTLRDTPAAWTIDAAAAAPEMQSAIQIHYPQLDQVTPYSRFVELRDALEARRGLIPTATYLHPGAHHGFLGVNKTDPADHLAAEIAWPATIAFLRAALIESAELAASRGQAAAPARP
jgi:carboxymethylenebutenolidase